MGYPADTNKVVYLFGVYTLNVSFSAVFKATLHALERNAFMNDKTILSDIRWIFWGNEQKRKDNITRGYDKHEYNQIHRCTER